MNPGDVLGTWRLGERVRRTGRTRYNVRCVHCGTERQVRVDQLSQCAPWHKGCSSIGQSTRRYASNGGNDGLPGTHPLWAQWSAELHMDPTLREVWPPSRVQSVEFWRQNQVAERMAWKAEDWASARATNRQVVP